MHEYALPSLDELLQTLKRGCWVNEHAMNSCRPIDPESELPGGVVYLPQSSPCVIVPDLHARPAFVDKMLATEFPGLGLPLCEALSRNTAAMLFLGDIPHAEGPEAAKRWKSAYEKIVRDQSADSIFSPEMDREMGMSLRALIKVIDLQSEFPESVFCLKGNHDNMTNAADHGDLPFYKYADEGLMGAWWLLQRYDKEVFHRMRDYELSLPLVAVGWNFCASHAEPAYAIAKSDIVSSRAHADIVRALIWTANGEAEDGAVFQTLSALLGSEEAAQHGVWFSGHRPVEGTFGLRAHGQLIQIHNPQREQVVFLSTHGKEIEFFEAQPSRPTLVKSTCFVLDPRFREK